MDLVKENKETMLTRDIASYADFVVAGLIRCFQIADEECCQRLLGLDPALEPLFKACGKWLERDDH